MAPLFLHPPADLRTLLGPNKKGAPQRAPLPLSVVESP